MRSVGPVRALPIIGIEADIPRKPKRTSTQADIRRIQADSQADIHPSGH